MPVTLRVFGTRKFSLFVDKAMAEQNERAQLTADQIIRRIEDNITRCESEDDYQPFAALKGLELLGKRFKLFTDKVEHSGTISYKEAVEEGWDRVIKR
jgi:hypothetical protein